MSQQEPVKALARRAARMPATGVACSAGAAGA
jgi:hypothetical protein